MGLGIACYLFHLAVDSRRTPTKSCLVWVEADDADQDDAASGELFSFYSGC